MRSAPPAALFTLGLACLAMGAAMALYALGYMDADAESGQPSRGWTGAMALGVLALAVHWLYEGGRAVFWGRRRDSQAALLQMIVPITLILYVLATGLTYAALSAWFPGGEHFFEGGFTGTLTEFRIVFTLAALVAGLFFLCFAGVLVFALLNRE